MAYQRLQVGRALGVIPSDTINIPNVAAVATSGTTTNASGPPGVLLADSTKNFPELGVKVGDIVVAGNDIYTVTGLVGTNYVEISGSTSVSSGVSYTIYSQADNPSNGCTLYVGLAGNLTVQTVGGDVVQFTGVPTGSFIPVHVLKVMSTGTDAQNIVALW